MRRCAGDTGLLLLPPCSRYHPPMAFDRTDPAGARAVIARLYPDLTERHAFLAAFADAVEVAAQAAPAKWSITLLADRVRLLMGRPVICTLHDGAIWFSLDRSAVSPVGERSLRADPDWQPHTRGTTDTERFSGYYLRLDPESASWPIVFHAFAARVQQAAGRYHALHPMSADAWSPSVLEYIESELGRRLPRPAWLGAESPSQPSP